MSRSTYTVQAQRSDGTRYIDCEVHRATNWAVIKLTNKTVKGRRYSTREVLGRYATRTQAQGMADANTKVTAPTPRHLIRKLGLRLVKESSQ